MLFSIILIVINILILRLIWRCSNVNLFLKIIIIISYFGWNAYPLIISYLDLDNANLLSSKDLYIFCANVNQIYFAIVLAIFYYLLKHVKQYNCFKTNDFQTQSNWVNGTFYISIVFVLYKIYRVLSSTTSYLDNNDVEQFSSDSGSIEFINNFFLYSLLAIYIINRELLSKKQKLTAFILIVIYYCAVALQGGRISLFAIIIILIYQAIKYKNKIVIFVSISCAIFGFILLPILGSLRGTEQIRTEDIVLDSSFNIDDISQEIYTKTNSVNTTTPLIEHDGIGGGGSRVYTSTLYALVPRTIMPSKPQPGSCDGTLYGLPSRLSVIYALGNYNGITNWGISSSLEMLWAVGWIGYIILMFINAYILCLFNQILNGKKIIFIYMFLSLIGFPVCMIDVPLSKLLISSQRFVILYFILFLIGNMKPIYHKIKRR